MSEIPAETTFYPDLLEPSKTKAPSWGAHLVFLLALLLMGTPSYFLFRSELVVTLLLLVPFSVVCLLEPFLGLCLLFAISPVDSILDFGLKNFSGSKILAIPTGLGFLLHVLVRPEARFRVPREVWVLFLLTVWSLLALTWTTYPWESFLACTQLVLLTTLMVMVVGLCQTPRHIKQLLLYVVGGAFIVCVYALATGNVGQGEERTSFSVSSGSEVNPNTFGFALGFGLYAAIFLLTQSRRLLFRLAYVAVMVTLLLGIAATQSRGTFVFVAASMPIGLLVCYRKNFLKVLIILIVMSATMFAVGWLLWHLDFFSPAAKERLLQPVSEAGESRFHIWRTGFEHGLERPLTGWGFGIFKSASGTARDPHDVYLKLFVELGIPGLVMWLVAMFMLGYRALKAVGGASFYIAAVVIAITVSGLVLNNLVSKTAWYEIGTILAISIVWAQSRRGPDENESLDDLGEGSTS